MTKHQRPGVPSHGTVVDWEWFIFDRFNMSATGSNLSTFREQLARTDRQGGNHNHSPHLLPVILIELVALLRCYLRFDGPLVDDPFQLQTPKSEMSWIMRKPCIIPNDDPGRPIQAKSYPIFRTEDFRSTLNIGWIPDSGLDFFTLFFVDLHKKWKDLMERADSHLINYVSKFRSLPRDVMIMLIWYIARETLAGKREEPRFHRQSST